MAYTFKQLAQGTAGTTATSLYSPAASTEVSMSSLVGCNTGTGDITVSVYFDGDGSTYDAASSLYVDYPLGTAGTSRTFEFIQGNKWYLNNASGNLAVKSSVEGDATFTLCGVEDA